MLNTLISFLAPAAASPAAVESSPPAVAPPAVRRPRARTQERSKSLRFALQVVGDALGFAVLFGGCWLTLQLMAMFV